MGLFPYRGASKHGETKSRVLSQALFFGSLLLYPLFLKTDEKNFRKLVTITSHSALSFLCPQLGGHETEMDTRMNALEELKKDFQKGSLVIFVDEDKDPNYRSIARILDRDGDQVELTWPTDNYFLGGWYSLEWLIIRSIRVITP